MKEEKFLTEKEALPGFFEPLFWSFSFAALDVQKNKKTIIVQTLNYGSWKHWQWISKKYGKKEVAQTLLQVPETEFRKGAFALAKAIFHVNAQTYAHRSTH